MPQAKILVDSNSYFRLAQSIHPLLQAEFGEERYCLYVIKELQAEYDNSRPRLKNKFSWVNEPEYRRNRNCELKLSRKNKKVIEQVSDFIRDYARDSYPGLALSRVDIRGLAHAQVLGIPIVTDDSGMLDIAGGFGIKTLNTLELLKLMLACRHIDIAIVRQIAAYWVYADDMPKSFASDYKRLFKEPPPK